MKKLAITLLSSLLVLVTLLTTGAPRAVITAEATTAGAGAAADKQSINWQHYGGSEKGNQHVVPKQITQDNVSNMKAASRLRTGELGQKTKGGYSFQSNPVLVEGRLYVTTGSAIIIALDPLNGIQLWRYDPKTDRTKATAETANRGAAFWIENTKNSYTQYRYHIFTGNMDGRLIAVDGITDKPCFDFSGSSETFLTKDVRLASSIDDEYSITSPTVIVNDVIATGSSIGDNRGIKLEPGIVRGFDARSGEEIWRFDPIPRTIDDPEFSGWIPTQAPQSGARNAWAPIAGNTELGLIYVPTGSVSPDLYGGERKADNRDANSLVALNAQTGEIAWPQQVVHYDVWDYDLPEQPTLVELKPDCVIMTAVIHRWIDNGHGSAEIHSSSHG